MEIYSKAGGTPWLDGAYTIFGQVYDGLDIIFEIQKTETGANDKPVEDVIIESVKVGEYDGSAVRWYISDYNGSSPVTEQNAETPADDASEAYSEESPV